MFIQQKQERNYTHKNNAPKGARRKAMQDLINELKKNKIEFSVLKDGSIDCEETLKLQNIECLDKYNRYAYVDDFETGRCRNIIKNERGL